eukprot:GHVU01124209.1.p1 GENE.GHVU01124209.1~~GHVU01124209.1.p1  ORF type:complete len:993 (+),score=88.19 GHVU01124209.1:3246-6224(+)
MMTADVINRCVSAEIPTNGPLRNKVLKHMIHHQCNSGSNQFMCLKDGVCSKGFPRTFEPTTRMDGESGRFVIRRRSPEDGGNTVEWGGRTITNEWVANYSPWLVEAYDCHCYMDLCTSARAVKYMCSYMTKGPDFAMVGMVPNEGRNEVSEYVAMRYTGACEAVWRLFGFPITDFKPAVERVGVHLEGQDIHVAPDEPEVLERIANNLPPSKFMAWMTRNRLIRDGELDMEEQTLDEVGIPEELDVGEDMIMDLGDLETAQLQNNPHQQTVINGRERNSGHDHDDNTHEQENNASALDRDDADTITQLPMFTEVADVWRWDSRNHRWLLRALNKRFLTLTRVLNVHPTAGELFFLRCLVVQSRHTRGARSYEDIRTINGHRYATFGETCLALGLIENDTYLFNTMREAATHRLATSLRAYYVVLIVNFNPPNASELFHHFWSDLSDDFGGQDNPNFTREARTQLAYMDIQRRLLTHGKDFEVTEPHHHLAQELRHLLPGGAIQEDGIITDDLAYDRRALEARVRQTGGMLNQEQQAVVEQIERLHNYAGPKCSCVLASAGTGKTTLLNYLLDKCRLGGGVAIAVAISGIAASLLHGGRTFHSRFKCPLDVSDGLRLNISARSTLADLIRKTTLIVIDEISMAHKNQLDALDKALRDIRRVSRDVEHPLPFGGIMVLVTGDFKQILPIDRWDRSMGVQVTVKNSTVWRHFKQMELRTNMRLQQASPRDVAYQQWIDDLGNGRLQQTPCATVKLPEGTTAPLNDKAAIDWVYPNFEDNFSDPEYLKQRLMVTPVHATKNRLSNMICARVPGEATLSYIHNAVSERYIDEYHTYPPEVMAAIDPPNFPPHELSLKPNMVVMLLRNLDAPRKLCNGRRLIIRSITRDPWLIVASYLDEPETTVFIPRIKFVVDPDLCGFEWTRVQFPVVPAYVTTINKAQGQTVLRVGVFLDVPVFAHGQLYTAATRTRSASDIMFFIPHHQTRETLNIVLHQALL